MNKRTKNYRKAADKLLIAIWGSGPVAFEKVVMHIAQHSPKAFTEACSEVFPHHADVIIPECVKEQNIEEIFIKAMVSLCTDYGKISCIKFYRQYTDMGLKEAKDFVEELQARHSFSFGSITYIPSKGSVEFKTLLKNINFLHFYLQMI